MTMSGERGVEKAERFPWEYKSAHRSAVRYSLSSIFFMGQTNLILPIGKFPKRELVSN